MSLGNYASACRNLLQELRSSLSAEDVEALAADCVALELNGWERWVSDHEAEIVAFVSAPPSARRARRAWQDPRARRRLTLAAILHLLQAGIVLDTVDQMDLQPGGSCRDMAARAGEAYNRIVFDQEVPLWPFDEMNPFT